MGDDRRITASPERELDELRARQRADRKKREAIERRMADRQRRIGMARQDSRLLSGLKRANVRNPLLVIMEADHASDSADVPIAEFRAMALTILKKETGLPQHAIFGCDHGAQGGVPPYCHEEVTPERGKAFVRALHSDVWRYMNGVHWTQTTWYEKVYRVEKISPDLTSPGAHLRVCLGDLALLRDAYGVATAFERYNGAGPAAEAYRVEAMSIFPGMLKLVQS